MIEYKTDVKVFAIEDGELHHYAARSSKDALACHISTMTPDDKHPDINEEPADADITVRFEDRKFAEQLPAEWERIDEYDRPVRVLATAAQWAEFYTASAPIQICSSVF